MDFFHILFEFNEHFFVLVEPLVHKCALDGRDTRDNKTDVVLRSLEEEVCRLFVEVVARVFHPAEQRRAAHRTENYSVLDFKIADFPRCKQTFVFGIHIFPSFREN